MSNQPEYRWVVPLMYRVEENLDRHRYSDSEPVLVYSFSYTFKTECVNIINTREEVGTKQEG